VVASMYAVYHGPQGLKRIAERVASFTAILSAGLQQLGLKVVTPYAFDTLTVECEADAVLARALAGGANLRRLSPTHVGVALDETSTRADVEALWAWFSPGSTLAVSAFEAGVEP
jgi:glycine dehydrogenase